jgi:hypothetical protein
MKKEVIKDEIFEQSVSMALQQARDLLQNLLDTWNLTGLEPIQGTAALYELAFNPSVPYTEAVNKLKQTPKGLTEKQIEKFMAELVIPSDKNILQAAERCQKNAYIQRELSLFGLNGTGSVELTPKCQELIKKESVYVSSESQLTFFNQMKALIDELNRLNSLSGGALLQDNCRTLAPVFSTPVREGIGGTVGLNSESLRQILKNIQ